MGTLGKKSSICVVTMIVGCSINFCGGGCVCEVIVLASKRANQRAREGGRQRHVLGCSVGVTDGLRT